MTSQDISSYDTTARHLGSGGLRPNRALIAAVFLTLAAVPGPVGTTMREVMTDAFVAVAAFVALTLILFYGAERVFRFDIGGLMERARLWQLPIAAFLGATPGCGGAVVVVAAYASGKASFGAVVATLTATMGDAAFLLIATRPEAAAVLIPMQFFAGIITGAIVDRFLTAEFRPTGAASCRRTPVIGRIRRRDWAYLATLVPALGIGVAGVAGHDMDSFAGLPVTWIALSGIAAGLMIWATSPLPGLTNPADAPVTRMAEETAFITSWVLVGLAAYAFIVEFGGFDIAALFASVAIFLPLIGVLVGFIPGCGPQVIVATLYANGVVPFSALVGNAISNDGDALFPVIALAPRAAVMATMITAIPALVLGYGLHLFAPGFLN